MSLSTVRCRILGHAEIHTRGIRLTPESELQFALALFYCTQAGRDVPRDEIARLFWPKHTLDAARHCLRQAVYRLRVLGIGVRSLAKSTVLDTHLVDADFASVAADGAPSSAFLRLEDVEILPGFAPRFSRPFANWVEDFRGELGSRLRRGLVRAISESRARGRYADVERLCRFCLRLDPLNEEATLALAESVALAGGKAEAVGLIDRYAGEIGGYRPELRLPARLLRERISDRLIRRSQTQVELPMIGREEDVERIMSAFQRLRGNRAVSYVIVADAGVGKTRLAFECCRMAELQGARVLTIATQPSSRTQALFAVSELVDGLLQMPGAIGCAPAALECLRAMSSPVPKHDMSLTLDNDGEARFAMVRWSVLDVLEAILSEGPLVIHIDDAHQLDAQSQAILQDALRTHYSRALLLLFTMRPSEQSDRDRFARLFNNSTIHELPPLRDVSCGLLIQRFCAQHDETLDDAGRDRIIQLSGGNPLFLVELLKDRSNLSGNELPVTVQALLEERLARLSPKALTVLRAAAVLGLGSTMERILRLVDLRMSSLSQALSELSAAGMLLSGGLGITCRHDTIRELVWDRTPGPVKALLHRRAARVLGADALTENDVTLLWDSLFHWKAARSPRQYSKLALILAKRLVRLGLVTTAREVMAEIIATADDQKILLIASKYQAVAAHMSHDWSGVIDAVTRWQGIHTTMGKTPRTHSDLELLESEARSMLNIESSEVRPTTMNCVLSTQASVQHRLAAGTLSMLFADHQGDVDSASKIFDTIQQLPARSTPERIHALATQAIYHAAFGEQKLVSSIVNELADCCLTIQNPVLRARHLRRACFGMARFGDAKRARSLLIESLETFERLALWDQAALASEELGLLALASQDYEEVREWERRTLALKCEGDHLWPQAIVYELRVLLAVELSDPDLLPNHSLSETLRSRLLGLRRNRQNLISLEVLSDCLRGKACVAALEELRELHELMKTRGCQDLSACALVTGLLTNGERARAADELFDYVNISRRELLPLPRPLIELTNKLRTGFDVA